MRILPSGEEVTGATISMTFAPELVQVVDADPFTEGVQIQGLPPLQLVVENVVDNVNGTIRYTAGTTSTGPSTDFNLALITFEALDVATTPDMPTEVAFVVGPTDTGVSRAGQQLLRIMDRDHRRVSLRRDGNFRGPAGGYPLNLRRQRLGSR